MPRSLASLMLIITVLFSSPVDWLDSRRGSRRTTTSCSMCAYADTTPEHTYYEIMGLLMDATAEVIKKVYRKLALELHPDKLIRYNMSDAEFAAANERFLKIQEAYDVLGDADKRTQYDLKQSGVQYDMPVEDTSHENRYMRSSRFGKDVVFNLFIKSKRFKIQFEAKFDKTKVPDIVINLEIDLVYTLKGLQREHKFYKRVVCDACGGKGVEGECRTCELCGGTGVAKHLYFHPHSHNRDNKGATSKLRTLHKCSESRLPGEEQEDECDVSFGSMTEASCAACGGKGCTSPTAAKCPHCNGSGMKMKEATLTLNLAPGWADKHKMTGTGLGHEDFDGRRGDVILNLLYKLPPTWTYDEATGRLTCTKVRRSTYDEHRPPLMCIDHL